MTDKYACGSLVQSLHFRLFSNHNNLFFILLQMASLRDKKKKNTETP